MQTPTGPIRNPSGPGRKKILEVGGSVGYCSRCAISFGSGKGVSEFALFLYSFAYQALRASAKRQSAEIHTPHSCAKRQRSGTRSAALSKTTKYRNRPCELCHLTKHDSPPCRTWQLLGPANQRGVSVLLSTARYDSVLLCTTRYDSVLLCPTRYDSVLLCTTRCDSVLLCTTAVPRPPSTATQPHRH